MRGYHPAVYRYKLTLALLAVSSASIVSASGSQHSVSTVLPMLKTALGTYVVTASAFNTSKLGTYTNRLSSRIHGVAIGSTHCGYTSVPRPPRLLRCGLPTIRSTDPRGLLPMPTNRGLSAPSQSALKAGTAMTKGCLCPSGERHADLGERLISRSPVPVGEHTDDGDGLNTWR